MRGHDHTSSASAGHSHAPPAEFGQAFAIGISLNLLYVAVEAGYGFAINSMALVADAGHNLSDVAGLAIAWGAAILSKRAPSPRFTYGLRGSSILAALANAVLLLVACGAIGWEAIRRFSDPQPVSGGTVMAVAAVGICINALTAWLFARGRKGDINIRGAYLHMVADAAVSAAVVLAGLGILLTGSEWIDPVVSLLVVAVILRGTWGLLKDSVSLSLAAVPTHIDPVAVADQLAGSPGVAALHDLHIWPMSTTETAMTAHLLMPSGHPGDAYLAKLAHDLQDRFSIAHCTFQIELDVQGPCALAPASVV